MSRWKCRGRDFRSGSRREAGNGTNQRKSGRKAKEQDAGNDKGE